jgi:phage terminase large subunit-like protein
MNAVDYAEKVVRGEVEAPHYVILQAEEFLRMVRDEHPRFVIDEQKQDVIESLLAILVMPKGLKVGAPMSEAMMGYQWLFIVAVLCAVHRDDHTRRRYETAILEIARKNFKTYTIGLLFIILMLTEPRYSKFFSVAPDASLSGEVKEAIKDILNASTAIKEFRGKPRFNVWQNRIDCLITESEYKPLAYSNSRMDGRLPNAFLADEVGALPNSYAIEAMRSGQLPIKNKLGCIISTKYTTADNPFESEVGYAKRVLDGVENDDTVFALLYEPDNTKDWQTDDTILLQANPVAQELDDIWQDLLKRRQRAMVMESTRENFLTKHCNIIYSGGNAENFVDINDLQACRVADGAIDWKDRVVWLGVDLAMTNDNCSVAMVTEDGGRLLAKIWFFIPEQRIDEKNALERIDYRQYIEMGNVFACGGRTVDYGFIEEFIINIEKTYGVKVQAMGYDRYNALSTAQKLDKYFETVQIRQHSDTLHRPTKLLSELIAEQKLEYEKNPLLELNFTNSRCTFDTNLNRYITKKKSAGKIDGVVALINALCLCQNERFMSDTQLDFVVQMG